MTKYWTEFVNFTKRNKNKFILNTVGVLTAGYGLSRAYLAGFDNTEDVINFGATMTLGPIGAMLMSTAHALLYGTERKYENFKEIALNFNLVKAINEYTRGDIRRLSKAVEWANYVKTEENIKLKKYSGIDSIDDKIKKSDNILLGVNTESRHPWDE